MSSSWSSYDPTKAMVDMGSAAVSSVLAASPDLGSMGMETPPVTRPQLTGQLSELAQLSDGSSDEEEEEEVEEIDNFELPGASLINGMSNGQDKIQFTSNPLAREPSAQAADSSPPPMQRNASTNLSDDEAEGDGSSAGADIDLDSGVPLATRGRAVSAVDLRFRVAAVAPADAMKGVLGGLKAKADDFMARLEEQESLRAAAEARASIRHETPTERPPSVITFHASVSRTFGRSARLLDVDLEARTVVQVEGKQRKVVHCHKFMSFTAAKDRPDDLVCAIRMDDGYGNSNHEKAKVWRFADESMAQRFRNLVNLLNTSGRTLLDVFNGMDRNRKGYLNVLDVAYALKGVGQPVEEKEIRTMIMLARTVATVQAKSSAGTATGGVAAGAWAAPGTGQQMGLTVDYATFFELFAHSGQPVHTLEECLVAWRAKFAALESGGHASTSAASSTGGEATAAGGGGASARPTSGVFGIGGLGGIGGQQGQLASETLKSMTNKVTFPPLLPGEELVQLPATTGQAAEPDIGGLRFSLGLPNAVLAQDGRLRLSTYQLVLRASTGGRGARHRLPETFETMHVPWGVVAAVEEKVVAGAAHVLLLCKDLRIVTIAFEGRTHAHMAQKFAKAAQSLAFTNGISPESTFAFKYRPVMNPSLVPNGWLIYDPLQEFTRQGCFNADGTSTEWYLVDNSAFKKAPTYPAKFVMPLHLTPKEFKEVAKFRSKKRLPALTWQSSHTKACLARCAQPLVGVTGARSAADERLLELYRLKSDLTSPQSQQDLHGLYLMDCRAAIAATGNSLKGAGVENAKNYVNATLKHCNIGNIHTMRQSLNQLADLVVPSPLAGKAKRDAELRFLSSLEESKWLLHAQLTLEAAVMCAEKLHLEGASVVLHCSDGWDRTAQVSSLAQILLDPFCRTLRGLAVVVEKDWCSFGHKFSQRCGHGTTTKTQERSPIFLQFLDALHQIMRQYPDAFQYNDRLLVFLADHLYSGLFGTFLGDCERDRVRDLQCPTKTTSVWTYVLGTADQFLNRQYVVNPQPLWPSTSMKKLVLWSRYYSRWDPDVCPRYDKDSDLSWHDDWGSILDPKKPAAASLATPTTSGQDSGSNANAASSGADPSSAAGNANKASAPRLSLMHGNAYVPPLPQGARRQSFHPPAAPPPPPPSVPPPSVPPGHQAPSAGTQPQAPFPVASSSGQPAPRSPPPPPPPPNMPAAPPPPAAAPSSAPKAGSTGSAFLQARTMGAALSSSDI